MFKLGCDPECFLMKDGHVISAIGLIGGSKYEPKPILEEISKGFALQEDNVLLEYNIPPAASFSEFTDNLHIVHRYIDLMLADMGLSRATIASVSMDPKELEDPMAKVFGCEPDFNAWTMRVNPKPKCDDPNFRSAGGHIHIGKPDMVQSQAIATVRWLDKKLGAFLLKNDPDKERQKLYGAPGAMRFKPYGVEYRTPSNWWTFQPVEILEQIWELIDEAIKRGSNGKILAPVDKGFGPETVLSLEALEKWEKE